MLPKTIGERMHYFYLGNLVLVNWIIYQGLPRSTST